MTDKHTDIRESLAKITPGPWYASGYTVATEPGVDSGYPPDPRCICHTADGEYIENYNEHDVEFIAAAPTYVRRLLDEVEFLQVAEKAQDNARQFNWIQWQKFEQENESLRKQVEFNRKYGIHSNAMKEIERLRKALTEIYEMETLCDQPSLMNAIISINEIARKALEGNK